MCKYVRQAVNHSALAVCSVCMPQDWNVKFHRTTGNHTLFRLWIAYSILVHTCTAPLLQTCDRPHLGPFDTRVYTAIWGVICIVISRPLTQNEMGSHAARPRELLNLAASEHPVSERAYVHGGGTLAPLWVSGSLGKRWETLASNASASTKWSPPHPRALRCG